jgi:hypothetical protein
VPQQVQQNRAGTGHRVALVGDLEVGAAVYDERIWIVGGYARGNVNDVWHSSDGRIWQATARPAEWSNRHEMACLVHNDRLWVMAGYGDRLYNDVWVLEER